jgi:predicted Zn-dependent peptidase
MKIQQHKTAAHLAALASLALAFACGSKQSGPTDPGGPGGPDPALQGGAGDAVFPNEPFRADQPAASAPRDFQLPGIKHFQIGTRDKVDVYLVEKTDLPTVSMELSFEGGAMTDPVSKVGLASVCMDMLTEGTAKLDKIAYNEALADLASSVSSYADDENQGVGMRSLTRSFDATFALFAETLLQPGFRKADFNRMIKRRLESLKQSRGSASSVAGRLRGLVLYGAKHPFGRVTTETSYKALKVGDCKAYHKRWLRPRGARLFVVGDMTEEKIRRALGPVLARWRGAPPKLAAPPRPRPVADVRVFFVDVPGSAQSVVSVMHMGPRRKASDYHPTQLAGQVLGGGFSSRINMNLREDKGYSYGARAGFNYSRSFGTFSASSSVRADTTYQTVLEMLREVRELQGGQRPPTPDELEREKEGTILAMPARFATAESTLGQYRTLLYFGLPLDYWNGYVESVAAVTPEQAAGAASTHLQPDKAVIMVVGDGKALQIARADGGKSDEPLTGEGGEQSDLRSALGRLREVLGDKGLTIAYLDPDGVVKRKHRVTAVPTITGGKRKQ